MGDEEGEASNVRVMTRVRPFNKREREISEKAGKPLKPCVLMRDNVCAIVDPETGIEREAFTFDECFWTMPPDQGYTEKPFADQKYVYERSGLISMKAAFDGYNTCIFAYGQTGSGKTYSMLGSDTDPGISPRLVDDLFAEIEKVTAQGGAATKFEVECTFMEVYNEKVRDLFNKKQKEGEYDNVKIRLHPQKGVFIEGLTRKPVATAAQTKLFIERGTKERAMAETKMNAHSSRSHAIFQIQIQQKNGISGTLRTSTINLVDLAGSEKVGTSGATGDRLTEAKNINLSLSTLRKVIDVLIENSKFKANSPKRKIAPFRESVLTWVLSDSLGGNSKTMMMTAISPHIVNVEETISTLRYALRAKAIVCSAKVNEEKSSALISNMKDEIMKLQLQLRTGGGGGVVNEELKKEIEERQKEMEKVEEEFQKKEAVLQAQIGEQLAQTEEMKVSMNQRRHQQFADAFRSAFSIKRNQNEMLSAKQLLAATQAQADSLKEENTRLEKETVRLVQQGESDKATARREIEAVEKQLSERDRTITDLNTKLTRERDRAAEVEQKLALMTTAKKDVERRGQTAIRELMELKTALEREKSELNRLKDQDAVLIREMAETRDTLRRKREAWTAQRARVL
eukprot:PhF_6_TR36567/c0_g1_i7/m.54014/K17914/KIF13; kinesin family member 13